MTLNYFLFQLEIESSSNVIQINYQYNINTLIPSPFKGNFQSVHVSYYQPHSLLA